jgi:hypothetical protein
MIVLQAPVWRFSCKQLPWGLCIALLNSNVVQIDSMANGQKFSVMMDGHWAMACKRVTVWCEL